MAAFEDIILNDFSIITAVKLRIGIWTQGSK